MQRNQPRSGRNTPGTFAISAASLLETRFAMSVRRGFASRRSPGKNMKRKATRGRTGIDPHDVEGTNRRMEIDALRR